MIEGSPHLVWETLPVARRHSLLLTLGQMAMRQIRDAPSPSTTEQMHIGETADDDRAGSQAAVAQRHGREDLPAAP
jgi:hypothetical protein